MALTARGRPTAVTGDAATGDRSATYSGHREIWLVVTRPAGLVAMRPLTVRVSVSQRFLERLGPILAPYRRAAEGRGEAGEVGGLNQGNP